MAANEDLPSEAAATADAVPRVTRVGLISDTHGRLDPRVVAAFQREQPLAAIVHAGDVGASPEILWELGAIAPVTAVLGNCDSAIPGFDLEGVARVTVAGVRILAIHDFRDLGPIPGDVDVIVRGHSHIPSVQCHGGVQLVNPGSASQRRKQPSCTVGVLEIPGASHRRVKDGASLEVRIIDLDELGPPPRG